MASYHKGWRKSMAGSGFCVLRLLWWLSAAQMVSRTERGPTQGHARFPFFSFHFPEYLFCPRFDKGLSYPPCLPGVRINSMPFIKEVCVLIPILLGSVPRKRKKCSWLLCKLRQQQSSSQRKGSRDCCFRHHTVLLCQGFSPAQ